MLTKNVFPYEFFARWDETTGALKGFHFKTITSILEDGKVISAVESDALTPALAAAAGFPLATIIDNLNDAALSSVRELEAETATLKADFEKLNAELKAKNAEHEAAIAELANVTAQRDALAEQARTVSVVDAPA